MKRLEMETALLEVQQPQIALTARMEPRLEAALVRAVAFARMGLMGGIVRPTSTTARRVRASTEALALMA